MYNIRPTTKFQKDLKRVKKRGFDIPLLTDIIKKLAPQRGGDRLELVRAAGADVVLLRPQQAAAEHALRRIQQIEQLREQRPHVSPCSRKRRPL